MQFNLFATGYISLYEHAKFKTMYVILRFSCNSKNILKKYVILTDSRVWIMDKLFMEIVIKIPQSLRVNNVILHNY